jgi:RNA 2',3'-cyclic 3'-phosphodiesterase
MRLFTAIDLPEDILRRMDRLLNSLRSEAFVKWSPLDNLHITVKFIGEWPAERLSEIEKALSEIPSREPFPLEVRNLGWFPNQRFPKVLWSGIQAGPQLAQLAHDTERCLAPIGIPVEDRAYTPHLTLARLKTPVPLQALRKRVDELQPASMGSFEVNRFCLYRSDPGSHCSVYGKLGDFRFENASSAPLVR